jgi:hypothetical protein
MNPASKRSLSKILLAVALFLSLVFLTLAQPQETATFLWVVGGDTLRVMFHGKKPIERA